MQAGAFVTLSDDYAEHGDAAQGPLRPGQVGLVDLVAGRIHVKATNGLGWWYDAGAVRAVPPLLREGARVVLAVGFALGVLSPGEVGTLICDDDRTANPYHVRAPDGRIHWYHRTGIVPAPQGDVAAAAALAPPAGKQRLMLHTHAHPLGRCEEANSWPRMRMMSVCGPAEHICNLCGESGVAWRCITGCDFDACAECGEGAELRSGTFVTLSDDYAEHGDAAQGPLRPGEVGLVDLVAGRIHVEATNGLGWWYDAGAVRAVPPLLREGARVVLAVDDAPGVLSPGEVGTLICDDDRTAKPYHVRAPGGRKLWYCRTDIMPAPQGEIMNRKLQNHAHPLGRCADASSWPRMRIMHDNGPAEHRCDVCGKSGVAWRCITGCDFDACAECGKGADLRSGTLVLLTDDYEEHNDAAQGPLRPGVIGIVLTVNNDDDDGLTFTVRAASGDTWIYAVAALRRAPLLREGARVVLAVDEADGVLEPGEVGTLICDDDRTSAPYHVRAPDGRTVWYHRRDIMPAPEDEDVAAAASAPAVAHALAPAAGPRPVSVAGAAVTRELAVVGLRVVRGPEWHWGEQDGGAGGEGVITDVKRMGWCTVAWDAGIKSTYRYSSAADLAVAVAAPPAAPAPGAVTPPAAFVVGDAVCLAPDYARHGDAALGPLTPGVVGRVTALDDSTLPIQVQHPGTSACWWYAARNLQPAATAPAAAEPPCEQLHAAASTESQRSRRLDRIGSAKNRNDWAFTSEDIVSGLTDALPALSLRDDFEDVVGRLRTTLADAAPDDDERHRISVNRESNTELLASSSAALGNGADARWLAPLHVRFQGENGVDAGGLTREWFAAVSRALLETPILRRTAKENAYEFYINPRACSAADLSLCEFLGAFMGKALLEGSVDARVQRHGVIALGGFRLCDVFFKVLLGEHIVLKDLKVSVPLPLCVGVD
jgi:hypothetical protein